jgi:GntR family transcriptional regulator
MLAIPRGSVAFCIYRLRCIDGVPFEWRKTLVRGDKFAIVAKYSERTGYKLDLSVGGASGLPQNSTRARTKGTPRAAGKGG